MHLMPRVVAAAVALVTIPPAGSAQTPSLPRFLMACVPCHGFDGTGQDERVPNLAGQHRDYLRAQLLAFRTGERRHSVMNFFSGQMTQEELVEIVDYYLTLPRP